MILLLACLFDCLHNDSACMLVLTIIIVQLYLYDDSIACMFVLIACMHDDSFILALIYIVQLHQYFAIQLVSSFRNANIRTHKHILAEGSGAKQRKCSAIYSSLIDQSAKPLFVFHRTATMPHATWYLQLPRSFSAVRLYIVYTPLHGLQNTIYITHNTCCIMIMSRDIITRGACSPGQALINYARNNFSIIR